LRGWSRQGKAVVEEQFKQFDFAKRKFVRSWASKAGRLVCHPPLEGKRRVHTAVNHEVSAALSQLYRELDVQIAKFQATTGLHCPPGCGQCCENPEVEATSKKLKLIRA